MFVAAIPTVGCRSQTCYCGTCCTASRLYKAPVGLDAHVLEAQCLGVRYPPRGDHASIHLKQKQPDTTTGRHVKQLPHEAQRSHQSRTARCQRITFKLQTANELQLQSIALTLTLYKIYIYYIYIYIPSTWHVVSDRNISTRKQALPRLCAGAAARSRFSYRNTAIILPTILTVCYPILGT